MLGVTIENIQRVKEQGYIIEEKSTEVRIISADDGSILIKILQNERSALLEFWIKEKLTIENMESISIIPFNHSNGFMLKIKSEGENIKWYKFKLERARIIFKKYH